jgi:hypothetical protein
MKKQQLPKATPSVEEPQQTEKPPSLNNQKPHPTRLLLGMASWFIYIYISVPNAKRFYELMKNSGHTNLLSVTKVSIIFPGPLILSILAGSIHAYIINRHEDEKSWTAILPLTTCYLGFIVLLWLLFFIVHLVLELVKVL